MKLDLNLNSIKDTATREALTRIQDQFRANPLLGANWALMTKTFTASGTAVQIPHSLPFTPTDSLVLSITGNTTFVLRPELFTSTNLYANVGGACSVRFIVGRI